MGFFLGLAVQLGQVSSILDKVPRLGIKLFFLILPSDTIPDLRDCNAIQQFNPAEAIVASVESRGRCSLGKSGWKCFDEAGQAVSLQY